MESHSTRPQYKTFAYGGQQCEFADGGDSVDHAAAAAADRFDVDICYLCLIAYTSGDARSSLRVGPVDALDRTWYMGGERKLAKPGSEKVKVSHWHNYLFRY